MAEGGYDCENLEFDTDDYGDDIDHLRLDDKLPTVPDEPTQRIASNLSKHLHN